MSYKKKAKKKKKKKKKTQKAHRLTVLEIYNNCFTFNQLVTLEIFDFRAVQV